MLVTHDWFEIFSTVFGQPTEIQQDAVNVSCIQQSFVVFWVFCVRKRKPWCGGIFDLNFKNFYPGKMENLPTFSVFNFLTISCYDSNENSPVSSGSSFSRFLNPEFIISSHVIQLLLIYSQLGFEVWGAPGGIKPGLVRNDGCLKSDEFARDADEPILVWTGCCPGIGCGSSIPGSIFDESLCVCCECSEILDIFDKKTEKIEFENISNAWMNQNDSECSSRNRTSSECSDQLFNPSSVDSLFSYSKSLEITKTGSIRVVKQTFVGPLRPSTADFNMQTRRTLIFIYSSIPIPLVIEHWCHILTSGSCLRSIPISDSLKKGINYRFYPLWVPKIPESVPKRDSIIENVAAWISALYLACYSDEP